jgi:mono/diheme cytochrome c family protein
VVVLGMDAYMATAEAQQQSPYEEFTAQACVRLLTFPPIEGEIISVAFDLDGNLLVQSREPSTLQFFGRAALAGEQLWEPTLIALGTSSRHDTGHQLFHYNTSGGIACASCHAEVGDDGNVWTFKGLGLRRTQSLSGGLLGSEPLHWGGDMQDFGALFDEVFVGRMTGFPLEREYVDALASWIDAQPSLKRTPSDAAAVERGRALFESTEVGCADCHSGPLLTNNTTVDVGTGEPLQVPSLKGVSFRAPYLYNGCAETLRARFGECGGGDRHGNTSQLSESELDDLVAYLESL